MYNKLGEEKEHGRLCLTSVHEPRLKMAHITSTYMLLTRFLEGRNIKECAYILKSLLLPAVSYIRFA